MTCRFRGDSLTAGYSFLARRISRRSAYRFSDAFLRSSRAKIVW